MSYGLRVEKKCCKNIIDIGCELRTEIVPRHSIKCVCVCRQPGTFKFSHSTNELDVKKLIYFIIIIIRTNSVRMLGLVDFIIIIRMTLQSVCIADCTTHLLYRIRTSHLNAAQISNRENLDETSALFGIYSIQINTSHQQSNPSGFWNLIRKVGRTNNTSMSNSMQISMSAFIDDVPLAISHLNDSYDAKEM